MIVKSWLRSWTTDPGLPLRQGRYRSRLRDEGAAAVLGIALAALFTTCFVTGLFSHLQQHPQSWFPIPRRPVGLYRVTQGVHVATGIASIPVLASKLWVVWPRFLSYPPVRHVADAVERVGLLPLVGGGVFMVFSGVANIAQWYPWRFSFTASHFWVAWLTMGALIAHVGAKWAVTWQALRSPSMLRGEEEEEKGVGRAAREPENLVDDAASTGLSRRGFLGTVAAASGVLTVTTVGQTLPVLRRLAVLAPRDPASGPQGYPVNRGAANAGVVERAVTQDYRLAVLGGRVPVSLTVDELMALPAHEAELPIACVEGWSFSATWRGVRLRDVLALAGAPPGRAVRVESLEPAGAYRTSTLDHRQAMDDLTLLATHLDGQRLAIDHGYPCRLIAPDRPGVLQTKWVSQVVVL
ncbi:MAG: hypothetical protein QOJ19_3527 [Acidimicrobiia bacterium]|nr:hypothetical protein [Acidimicrobiia bacterium]